MVENREEFESIRQMHTVLSLHYLEEMKQSEIAVRLNLSTSKVNRLITQGKKMGMVKIVIESPFQPLVDLENGLVSSTSLANAVVTPAVPGNPHTNLQQVGRAAANHLLETIRDGDVIAITGGKAISSIVQNLNPDRAFNVTVVPLTGGVQGKYYTDVNHLATQLAERLGGKAMLLHAPLFAESREQRDMLMEMGSIKEVLDLARKATVAIVGVGSIRTPGSSYFDLLPGPDPSRQLLLEGGVTGEFLAHLILRDGSVADYPLNSRILALSPAELAQCPVTIGVASGEEKVEPLCAALAGQLFKTLVIDEQTAAAVIDNIREERHVA